MILWETQSESSPNVIIIRITYPNFYTRCSPYLTQNLVDETLPQKMIMAKWNIAQDVREFHASLVVVTAIKREENSRQRVVPDKRLWKIHQHARGSEDTWGEWVIFARVRAFCSLVCLSPKLGTTRSLENSARFSNQWGCRTQRTPPAYAQTNK